MRIAVISDTHNRLPAHLPPLLAEADEIWHLGDVTDQNHLLPLEFLGRPLHVVRGNCDSCESWPWIVDLEREGFLIRLIHIPPREAPPGIDLVFHGHTHVPRNERVGEARFFNPGTVGKPNKGVSASYAWLELVRGKAPKWEVVPV
ncbi:MAG: metallophosphoesterase family protein [Verrucomicrobiota bacterium]